MAHKITIPFFAFKIQFQSGDELLIPLTDKDVVRIGQSFEILAGKYAEIIQYKLLGKGKFRQLLNEFRDNSYQKDIIEISFAKAKDGFRYPAFALTFDYFFSESKNGVHAIIPSLGIEAFASSEEEIVPHLKEVIRIEFARKKRLGAMQQIVSAIWFDVAELLQNDMELKAPSPAEVEENQRSSENPMLPKVAQLLDINRRVVYGMEVALEQLVKALKNQFNRSILLVGASGVGKTALVWELVRQQKKFRFKGQIWETTASTLIKELTGETGAWENNMVLFAQELKGSDHILFIRNLMELFEVGQYSGSNVSLADFLRNYIAQGEMIMISECTEEELARIELKSSNFLASFQIIRVQEPQQDLESIILQKVNDIASSRNTKISEDAIKEVIRLHRRFVPYAGMPGRPIRFLESMLINKKNKPDAPNQITRSEVIEHFCEETGMPVFMVDPAIQMNITKVKNEFHANVFGQDKAVDSIVNILASVKTALMRTGKPIASFLFVGPTGVGKTELAKVLAQFMFGSRQRMIRFDMSEFSDPYNVMRLTGTEYFSDGLLTSAVRREPFCVLLFDEIEKAHASFYDLLLQMLSEGRLTDNRGKLVNFCSTIIIMTSNIGAESLQGSRIGWNAKVSAKDVTDHFMNAVQKHFRPELFNRIDEVIPFEPLDQFTIRFVVEREIALLKKREGIRYRRMDLHVGDEVLNYLGEKGYHPRYGARYLQRVIREELAIPLAKALNGYDTTDQLSVELSIESNRLQVHVEDDPLALDLMLEELEKITQSNHTSNLRRLLSSLRDGSFYNQMLSELERLESEKKHNKNFWDNPARAAQYTDFLQIKEQVKALAAEIEHLELNLSLGSLGATVYNPQLYERVEQWAERFKQLKLRLFSALMPHQSVCFFNIYGTHLEEFIPTYLEIFQKKDFSFSAQTVWFRESFYNEELPIGFYDEDHNFIESRKKRKEYIKLDCEIHQQNWQAEPPHADDKLYGIEFTIFGTAAHLFLVGEAGVQRWKLSEKFDHSYVILVDSQAPETPENIHRRDFYTQQPPRRVFEPPSLRDTEYKINRELGRQSLANFLLEELEGRFELSLDEVIY